MLGLHHQERLVHQPGQIRGDVGAQEFDIVHTLHHISLNCNRWVHCPPASPVGHYDVVGLAGVEYQVVQ